MTEKPKDISPRRAALEALRRKVDQDLEREAEMKTDQPMFSRSGETNALGKNSEEVKALVPEELKQRLQALATIAGVNLSEYVRDLLAAHVYGQFTLLQMKSQGRNREGNGQEP